MFSVEASRVVPYPPIRVFELVRDCDALPRWCEVVRLADDTLAWLITIPGVTTRLRPRNVAIDADHLTAVHEASDDSVTIRWELTVGEHFEGASLHVRTSIDFTGPHEHQIAICRMASREAADDLARMAGLLDAGWRTPDARCQTLRERDKGAP
ncbi:MAG TPA: SRPBCC family protein [Gemmatimonadaceae bacterium]